ncbi:MAG: hypothetical protein OQK73_00310 [Gammaproteobacteria bacterium]|nr:hypothetical protein [Gammaproteobacteria bacterium]
MMYKKYFFIMLGTITILYLGPVSADNLKMPMKFKYDSQPTKVLQTYPLGTLNRMAVFSHHGKADKEVTLPNGRGGWVYDVSMYMLPKIYYKPNGEKKVVQERQKSNRNQMYILVFGQDGNVMDVIYQDKSTGLSALQLQYQRMMKE